MARNYNFFTALPRFLRIVWGHSIRLPWRANPLTLALAGLVLLIYLVPALQQVLIYDRHLIAAGQLWRGYTTEFVHLEFDHFVWNYLTLLASSSTMERLSRRLFLVYLGLVPWLMSAYYWWCEPQVTRHFGYSGLAAGVLVMILLEIARRYYREDFWIFAGAMAILLAFVAYETEIWHVAATPYEAITGVSIRPLDPGQHIIAGHLLGMSAGALLWLIYWARTRRTTPAVAA